MVEAYIGELKKTVDDVRASNRPEFGRMGERLGEAVAALAEATRWIGMSLREESRRGAGGCRALSAAVRPGGGRRLSGARGARGDAQRGVGRRGAIDRGGAVLRGEPGDGVGRFEGHRDQRRQFCLGARARGACRAEKGAGGCVSSNVIRTLHNDDGHRCVKIVKASDGVFGFQEFRRDPEDAGGWTLVRDAPQATYATEAQATAAARAR